MRVPSLVVSGWLAVVSAQAPFLHFHPDDPAHGHGGFPHTHIAKHGGTGVSVEAPDVARTALWLEWTISGKVSPSVPDIAPPERLFEVSAEEQVGKAPDFTARSHDPPDRSSVSARAPPQ